MTSPGTSPVEHARAVERDFDAAAGRYDLMVSLNPGYHDHLRAAAERLVAALAARLAAELSPDPDRRLHLLDLGCGTGASTRALVAALDDAGLTDRVELVGVDASAEMLAVARRSTWPAGVRFEHGFAEDAARRADEWDLPRPVDAVFSAYLFRNVARPDDALQAVHDLLAPGGVLVTQEYAVAGVPRSIALWTLVCWLVVIPMALVLTRSTRIYRYLWRSVLRFDGIERFTRRCRDAGYVDVSVSTVGGWQKGILHTVVARRPDGA